MSKTMELFYQTMAIVYAVAGDSEFLNLSIEDYTDLFENESIDERNEELCGTLKHMEN